MSQLFSKSIIKSTISGLQGLSLDREIALVNELYDDFRKGNMKDETRYEQNFNELFFHQLLGYDPKINLHPKASTPVGSKIADVGLGFFADGQYSYEGVKCVVELKGSEALLDKKQASYGGQTPVDQGFGYKTSFKDCPWLIVSNFASIRLYRDNKQDYELWTIEDLVKPDNDYYNLKSLLVILGKKYLISESGKSPTETRLSEVRIIQEQITKKFYQQYKSLRFELINDIRRHNPEVSIEAVVEKSQKIIDRVIFIHFCEDKGLLPDNKLRANIGQAREAGFTPREILKRFFHFIDVGSKDGTIPAYNGGLFAPDADLDTLEVGDEICYKFINLGDYSFDDELSVNILGHIFEQSISDIEQLKIELTQSTVIARDEAIQGEVDRHGHTSLAMTKENKKESKRKKDGIFYTPEYIVDYIVQNSLMTYLEEKEQECFRKYPKDELKAYQAYQQILQNVKVLDPACGSGAFLVKVFDYLYGENKRIGQIVGSLFDDDVIYKDILRNNIYGVDLNPESVEITKLSLWLKSAQKGKKLNNLDDNIKCGNSLVDDPAVAGDRAFDWYKEFPSILSGLTSTSKYNTHTNTKTGKESYTGYDNEMFGFDVIVGNPPYVRPHNIPEREKRYLWDNFESIEAKSDLYACFVEKVNSLLKNKGYFSFILPYTWLSLESFVKLRKFVAQNYGIISFDFYDYMVFEQAQVNTTTFVFQKGVKPELVKLNFNSKNKSVQRIDKPYEDFIGKDFYYKVFSSTKDDSILKKIKNNTLPIDRVIEFKYGIKTGDDEIFLSKVKVNDNYKKILRRGNFHRYTIEYQGEYVNYDPDAMRKHKTTARPGEAERFEREKILVMDIAKSLMASYDDGNFYIKDALILQDPQKEFAYKYILSLLNSKLLNFYYTKSFDVLSVALNAIKQLPIKEISLSAQQPFVDKADLMLSLNQQHHDRSDTVLRFLTQKYTIIKPSTKLQKRRELDFAGLLKELKSIKISLADQADLMDYFESKKKEILDLKSQIDTTDRQIDEMVFDLYGLTEEERRVVLES